MKNLNDRLEALEEIARRWNLDRKVYTSYDQYNNQVSADKWTQKHGIKRGNPVTFSTSRDALDWVIEQLEDDPQLQAQIYVDDIRSLMDADDCELFDFLFPQPPSLVAFFDLRYGQDFMAEAVRMWRTRTLAGVKYNDWWTSINERLDDLLQPE
jgi:hypothetical protein